MMLSEIVNYFKRTPTGMPLQDKEEAFSYNTLLSSGSFLQYNPDDLLTRIGYRVYKEMMNDEQVKAVIRFHRDAVTGRTWQFEDNIQLSDAENEKRRTVLTNIIHKMPGSFKTRLDMIMSSLYCGFSLVEKTFDLVEIEGKLWSGIKKLSLKPFDTFYFHLDDFGNLEKLEQIVNGGREILDISKFIHHVQNADVHEYYGRSELRECYRAWYCKDTIIKLNNIYLERMAAGFIWVQSRKGSVLTPKSTEYTSLQNVLKTIRTASSLIIPGNVELNVEHPTDTQAFERAVQSHDRAISKALLMPNLLGLSEEGKFGSRALGDTQLEAFLWMLDAEAGNLEEVTNEQLFQDLADQNFPDGLYPRWRLNELSDKKIMEIVDRWSALVTGNAVKPTMRDEQHIRSILDFPESEVTEEESTPVDPQTALTGVQVTAILKIIEEVAKEKIPRDTGIQILLNAFPINILVAEEIMGEVGKGFKPKVQPIPPGLQPGGPGSEQLPTNEGDPSEIDPTEGDPANEDQANETIIGSGGTKRIEAQLKAAKSRVAFAVIDQKTLQIEDEAVEELSAVVMGVVKPVTDDLRKVEQFDVDTIKGIKFNSKAISKVQKGIKRMLNQAWDLGTKHATNEVNKAAGQQLSISFVRLDEEAQIFFDDKSFRVTGKLTNDMKDLMEHTISQSIKTSATTAATIDQIYSAFGTEGFITKAHAEAEMTILLDAQREGGPARLNTIVRTNTFEALNEARYSYFTDPTLGDFIEGMEYSAILDSRTTQICKHLDGQTHAKEGEVWGGMWRPPNHFNCRSLLIPVTKFDKWTESPFPTQLPQSGFQ